MTTVVYPTPVGLPGVDDRTPRVGVWDGSRSGVDLEPEMDGSRGPVPENQVSSTRKKLRLLFLYPTYL